MRLGREKSRLGITHTHVKSRGQSGSVVCGVFTSKWGYRAALRCWPRAKSRVPCARLFPKPPLNRGISVFWWECFIFYLYFVFPFSLGCMGLLWPSWGASGPVDAVRSTPCWGWTAFAEVWCKCCCSARLMEDKLVPWRAHTALVFVFTFLPRDFKARSRTKRVVRARPVGDTLHLIRKWRFTPLQNTLWPQKKTLLSTGCPETKLNTTV